MNVVKFPLWYWQLLILSAAILSNFPFTPAVGLTSSSLSLENASLKSYSVFESLQPDDDFTGDSEYRLTQVITPANDGTGTLVTPEGNQFNINGGTYSEDGVNLFHSFEKFGLDAGQIANFLSNPEIRNILSRVVGGDASIINGLIQVTGGTSNLFLMNPAGIIFGPNASLNLPGDFTATTANGIQFGENWFNAAGLNNYEILVGNPTGFAFTMTHPGSVINLGTLAVEPGQNLTLLGGSVINNGILSAPEGQVIVTAVPGENFVRISQEGQLLNLEIRPIPPDSNRPHDWSLPITTLPDLLTQGASGYDMEAQVNPDGTIALVVEDTTIPVNSGTIVASGRLESTGETGGTVGIFGERVGLVAAEIDVSGTQGGGTVLVGGEYKDQGNVPNALRTIVDQNSIINADALLNGNGGRVIIWADEATGFYGQVNARGGNEAGNGGFVEVSGREYLDFQGNVDTSAINGSFGTLLLDPISIEIIAGEGNTATVNLSSEDTPDNATISADTINNSTSNIFLEATDDITFNADIDLREPEIGISAESTTINVNNTITTAGGNLNFTANTIVVPETGSLNANGGTIALTGDNIQLGEGRMSPEDGEKKLIQSEGGELIIQPRTFNQIVLGDDTENNPQALEITEEELTTLSSNFSQIEIILDSGDIFIDGDPPGVEFFEVKFLSPVRIEARNGSIIAREDRTIRTERVPIIFDASNDILINSITLLGGDTTIRTTSDSSIVRLNNAFTGGGGITIETSGANASIQLGTINTGGENLTVEALGNGSEVFTFRGSGNSEFGDIVTSGVGEEVGGTISFEVGNTASMTPSSIEIGAVTTDGGNINLTAFGNDSTITTRNTTATSGGELNLTAPDGSVIVFSQVGLTDRVGDIIIQSGDVTRLIDTDIDREELEVLCNAGICANSLTINSGRTTEIDVDIDTTNNQIYNVPVTLLIDTTLNSSAGNGNIEFNSTLNGNSNLQLNSGSGTITLGEVGVQNPLSSLTLTTTGQTNLGGNINIGELNINQPNIQLTSDVVINVSSGTTGIDFGGGTVNGNFNLELIAGDNNIILGTVGENQPLSSLTANSSGLTTLAGNIITSGIDGVNFADVTELNLINNINIDTSLGNGVINLEGGTIDGNFNLNLNAGSGEILLGQVGSNTPLNWLNIPTAGSVNLNGNLTTAENIDFRNVTGGTQLNADITITSNNGNISFNGSPILGEGNTLTLNTQNEVFLDNVGIQGEELGGLIVDNAETVNLFGNIFTDGGIRFPTVTTINLNGDLITLETDSDNGNIDFSNALVTGDSQLTINAGTGNIDLGKIGTETNEIGGLTIESATDINLSGDIFTNGGLDFSGTETVNLNVAEVRLQTSSDNEDINLSNTLVTGNSELTLNAGEAGEISLENVGNLNQPLEGLILESAANVNLSGSIFTNGDLDFSGVPTVSLLGTDVVLQTLDNNGIVNLANSSINAVGEGLRNLIINTGNGQVDLGIIGNQTPISSLTVNTEGETNLGGNITTSGIVSFSAASNVNLASDIVIDSSLGNGNIDFNGSNIDGDFNLQLNSGSGNITLGTIGSNIPLNNLTVNSTGTTQFNNIVNANSLITDAGGTTELNANITTINNQIYNDAVTLLNNITLDSRSNNGNIEFNSTIDGNSNLQLNAGEGNINLSGVGSFNQGLGSLIIESATNVNLSDSIFTNGDLDFSGTEAVNLSGTQITLQTFNEAAKINLSVPVNADNTGVGNLTINTENGQVDLGIIGNQTPISSLTVNTEGETNLGGNITTSGIVNFSAASNVDLVSDIVIDSSLGNGNIYFNGSNIDGDFNLQLNSGSGNITLGTIGSNIPLNDLTVNSTGTTSFNGTVNTESLVTNGDGITQINGNITTTGVLGQTYGDRLIILNNLILTGDEINFGDSVSGNNFDLTLQPFSLNRSISLGNTVNFSNSLNLTETELSLLQNGFNSLTIGSAETGQINILGNISFNDPVTLRSGLDSIQAIDFTLSGTDNASLTLEANQNITVGDILNPNRSISLTTANGAITARNLVGNPINLTTQGGDIALSPSEDLNLINPTILTNGGDFSINSSSVIQLSGSGQVETVGGNITFDGTDIFNTIPLNTSNASGQGGIINLTAQPGVVITDDLNSSGATGGAITVDAVIAITAGEMNSSGSIGNGGNVSLDPESDIEVEWIDTQGGANGRGGDVFVSTERFFRATGSFIDQSGREASISTAGGQGGGSVTLRHAGGPLRDPRSFFTVGANLTENGTAAAITTGEFTISSPNAFEGSFRLGNISIETDDLIPSFLLENEINPPNNQSTNISLNNQAAPQQEQSRILSDTIPKKEPIDPLDIATNLPCVPIDAGVIAVEQSYTQEFAEYWGISTDDAVKSLVETCNALQDIAGITGVKPGVIYVNFVPVGYELTTDQSSLDVQSLDRTQPQTLLPDRETDELEITLVTAEGQPIRKRISGMTRATVLEGARQFGLDIFRPGKRYLSSGQQLYQWLIAPIEAHLQAEEIENIVFIMDEGLRSLPIAALHDGEQFLIEKYSVGLAPSLTLTETRYSSLKQAQVLAMGTAQFTNLRPLPGVPVELSMIFKNAWQGELFLNEQFTISNLNTQRNQIPFGIVHLGTHAEFNSETPNNSYIQFWDERLRLDQVRDLNLNQPSVKLLVLSACKTLLGNREAELGFAGFAAKAGVESVLASLWSVDDKGTLPLMVEFYRQLATAPIKAEALRQAQIAMLRGEIQYKSDTTDTRLQERLVLPDQEAIPLPSELADSGVHELSHPFYWAAFTLVGSPW